ncbi:MAG: MFS transporter [Chloroflexi bacterium]|nr:MFS transporter [Chloroflexota bacterium]
MTASAKPAGRGWRGLPRNVWIVSLTSFLTDISSEMIVNLLPLFLYSVLGAKTSAIGVIEGVAETTASLLKVFSGWFSDRLGQRKWLTVLGYGLSTVAKPFFYLAASWPAVLVIRFLDRVGKGVRTAPRDALIADSVDESQRGLSFGIHRAGDTAGAFLGLLVAFLVVRSLQAGELALQRVTFQQVVLLSIIPAVLAVLVLALGAREAPVQRAASRPALSLAGLPRRFVLFLGIVVLFTLGNSSDAFLILRATERGLSVLQVLGMLLTFNAVYSLLSGPAGALSDRIGRRQLILGGWLVYGLIYLGFALAQSGWQVWALYGLYGVYYGLAEGTAKALVADLVPTEQRGTAFGVYSAAVGVTDLPASLAAGFLWQGVGGWSGLGPAAPFYFGAAMALAATVLLALWFRRA